MENEANQDEINKEEIIPESSVAVELNPQRHEEKWSRGKDSLTQSQREAGTGSHWSRYLMIHNSSASLLLLPLFLGLPFPFWRFILTLQFSTISSPNLSSTLAFRTIPNCITNYRWSPQFLRSVLLLASPELSRKGKRRLLRGSGKLEGWLSCK